MPNNGAANNNPIADALAGFTDWQRANNLDGKVKGLSDQLERARRKMDEVDFEKLVADADKILLDGGITVPNDYARSGRGISKCTVAGRIR